MADARRFVPLSQPLRRGTVGQQAQTRDTGWDKPGTTSLKALAQQALSRLGKWDKAGTTTVSLVPEPLSVVGQETPRATSTGEPAEWEERAAIAEYDGKLPRVLAEALARLEVCPPPPGTQPKRWQRAQAAFVELLATGAASQALATGWTPQELCGVSATAPHDAPSKAGLIFSMWPGDRIEGIDAWGCNIAAGQRWHTWRRVPASALVVMPWDLGS
jgi:hypothetical protein